MSVHRSHSRSWRDRALAAVAAALVSAGVAACTPENIAEQIIESGAEGVGDVEIGDDGSVTIEGEGGESVSIGGGELPAGFPSDDVPLLEGDISFAQSMSDADGESYTVMVEVSGDTGDAWQSAKSDLENAGFTINNESTITSDGQDYFSAEFGSAEWTVFVNASAGGDGTVLVAYVVDSAQP